MNVSSGREGKGVEFIDFFGLKLEASGNDSKLGTLLI
jgi:hypothetical protein